MRHVNLACIIPLGSKEPLPQHLIQSLLDQNLPVTISATESKPAEAPAAALWVSGLAGRAPQLNRGIEATPATWVWLIHADSQLSTEAAGAVQTFCQAANDCTIGHGHLQFASDGPRLVHLNGWGAYLRSAWLKQPYGDQTFCIHRDLWQRLSGFDTRLDRGEDLDFVIRARQLGAKTQSLPFTVTTSARRYRDRGWLRTTIEHQIKAHQLIKRARRWQP